MSGTGFHTKDCFFELFMKLVESVARVHLMGLLYADDKIKLRLRLEPWPVRSQKLVS